jgi:hypothetical protein
MDTVTLTLSSEEAAFVARILMHGSRDLCNYAQGLLEDWENAPDLVSAGIRADKFHTVNDAARRAQHMVPSLCAILTRDTSKGTTRAY